MLKQCKQCQDSKNGKCVVQSYNNCNILQYTKGVHYNPFKQVLKLNNSIYYGIAPHNAMFKVKRYLQAK